MLCALCVHSRWMLAAARVRTACAGIDTTAATDQNNLNSQSYTLLNKPAMMARLYSGIKFEEEVLSRIEGWAVAWKLRKATWGTSGERRRIA